MPHMTLAFVANSNHSGNESEIVNGTNYFGVADTNATQTGTVVYCPNGGGYTRYFVIGY